jgi:M6 family metalloprotease-like protein
MRKISLLCLLALALPLAVFAQREFTPVHGNCMSDDVEVGTIGHRAGRLKLPTPKTDWNPEREYRQMVILMEFADSVFRYTDDAHAFYDSLFNERGFNKGFGVGCVADYYRDQSEGRFNLKFDVYGPYKVSKKAQPIENPTGNTQNYGKESFVEATKLMLAENSDIDFSVYDWNGDMFVDQIIYVYASYPGNLGAKTYGFTWPSTGLYSTISLSNGYKVSNYSSSGELWPTKSLISCGLGTICHEFTHSLGLPDIYPTNNTDDFSVCDEWDLMDGGNYTNYGWCPPNYTPVEKWLMGWLNFTDLDEPTSVVDMKPVADGGEVYRIKHSETEWLLLENRQQRGWDKGMPGSGLVIYHVQYDRSAWSSNTLNNNKNKRRFELVHADNMDYDAWNDYLVANNLGTYVNSKRMNSRLLSSSPYPWTIDIDSTTFVNDSLTENSVPAPKMNNVNEQGDSLLRKSITNIRVSEDGLISFDFMGGDSIPDAIVTTQTSGRKQDAGIYDLRGRRLKTMQGKGVFIRRNEDGTMRKYFK